MRIISGKFRSRNIRMPEGIRPTQDRVRKSLFDILKLCIEGAKFLDLFAGSGIVGIEALSRGAKEVVFVENESRCLKTIEANLSSLGVSAKNVVAADADKFIERMHCLHHKFDLIFLDPPYYEEAAKKTLQTLGAYDILTAYGLVIVQHYKKDQLPENSGKLVLWRMAKYGQTILSFYRKQPLKKGSYCVPEGDLPGNL